jgi:acyl carrier protein
MTDEEVLGRLTGIFRDIFRDDSIVATPETTAADIERWDSLTHIDMVLMVEQDFGIRVPTRAVSRMRNVGDLVLLIRNRAA